MIKRAFKKLEDYSQSQPLVGMMFYTALGFLRPAILIILLPVYLSVFSVEEWAVYSLMVIVGSFAMVLVTGRIAAAMLNHYYDYLGQPQLIRKYLSSLFSASIYIGGFVLILIALTGEYVFDLVFKSEEILFYPYGITIIAYAVLSEINLNYYIFLKNEKNLGKFALVTLTQMLLLILFQYIMIVVLREGVQGALIGMLASNIITSLLIVFLERDILTLKPDWSMVKPSLAFSLPLIPYLIIYWFMTKGERIVLEQMMDLQTVGQYVLLITISGVAVLLIEAVINGVRPFLFEFFTKASKEYDSSVGLLTKLIVNVPLLILPVIIVVGTNIQFITDNTDYHSVSPYITVAAIVSYCIVFGKLFYQQLIYAKQSALITRLSLVCLIIFLISLYFLIPPFKIWGVLASVWIVNAAFGVLFYFFAQKYQRVNYHFRSLFLNPLIVIVAILILDYWMISSGYTLSQYGVAQFFVILMLIMILNRNSIREYRRLFVNS